MSKRIEALWRLWTLVWQATVGGVLNFVVGILALVWAIVDLLWQLIAGSDGLPADSTPGQWVSRTLSWTTQQTIYVITGAGDGQWRPLP